MSETREPSALAASDVVEVALPLAIRHPFSYRVPEALASVVLAGSRVAVPFRGRPMVGVVLGRAAPPPAGTM